MSVVTLSADLRIAAAGGPAMILNPVNMEVLDNDVVSNSWVHLPAGTQIMLVGAFEKTDTWLLVVTEGGALSESEQTYGLVVRRKSWEKIVASGVTS